MGICVVIGLSAVWSVLHITVEPILIILGIGLGLIVSVTQCEKTIIDKTNIYR